MDSQENALQQGAVEQPAAEQSEVTQQTVATEAGTEQTPQPSDITENPAQAVENKEEAAAQLRTYSTKEEVLARAREIAQSDETPAKAEIDQLKSVFHRLNMAEKEEHQKAYLEAGGDPEKYTVSVDDTEMAFKAEMALIREKRAKLFELQEKEKGENLERKLAIIEKIKAMATSPEDANKAYKEFKELQQQWKEIKAVPAEKANEVWQNYHHCVEQYYDLLRLNIEARDYDFKKNLEAKTALCEAAEKLAEEADVVRAFHRLQELHQEYRDIGPVARDLREEVWARFKAASTVINKKHQDHFDKLHAAEQENLEKKTALCERAEALSKEENNTAADWDRHSKEIMAIQAEWKTIGFAPQKMNQKIFERFRAVCDAFFTSKAEFFKQRRASMGENAEKKRAIVEKAQELMTSTDWKATGDKLVELQKEWRTIGPASKKVSDKLWIDFRTACNHFFEARSAATSGTRNEERENLAKKKEIIAKLAALVSAPAEDSKAEVHALAEEYNSIGHVPFREKDKVYAEYKEVMDKIYKELHISVARRRLDEFKNSLKDVAKRGEDALDSERSRLVRRYEQMRQEVMTYENNLGFLNASSKKGNSLVDEMNRRVERLKDEVKLVKEKIKAIDKQAEEE